jgi:hypothetical protein
LNVVDFIQGCKKAGVPDYTGVAVIKWRIMCTYCENSKHILGGRKLLKWGQANKIILSW